MRGRGIAEALMNEVESFARQNGCARMFLTTTPFLTSAIRLYERYGFTRVPNGAADLFGTPLIKMEKNLDREQRLRDTERINHVREQWTLH
jgi:N-acetylglutamate synthase-like GNAT family acetyltransferase